MVLINPKNKKNFDRDQFIKDYEELKSACRMAEKYKCCKKTILEYARKFGYVNHYRPELTQEQNEYIVANYEYKTALELAKELNVSSALISKVWCENGKRGKHLYYPVRQSSIIMTKTFSTKLTLLRRLIFQVYQPLMDVFLREKIVPLKQ